MWKDRGKSPKLRFGEILLEYGIITKEQLNKALRRQVQVGGHIGSILREMDYLDDDSLLSFLSRQFNTSHVNLFETKVPPDILRLLPFGKVKSFSVLPVKVDNSNITLAMVNPNDVSAIQEVEFALGRRVAPAIVPSYQMEKAISYFEEQGYGHEAFDGEQLKTETPIIKTEISSIYSLLRLVLKYRATHLHVTAGVPPAVRIDDEIKRLPLPDVTSEQMSGFAQEVLSKEQKDILERGKEIDFAITLPDAGRFRVNMYRQRGSISLSARFVKENIPSVERLGLPEWIIDYALKSHGFILITGPSGHGKTTTMSALVDIINSNRRCNIVTLEDPIEYLHRHKKSNINQREVGIDTESFAEGLKHIFNQDPDVIVIGEMRDPESVVTALIAAETGHLVISTLNSQNATTAVERIFDFFPQHQQHQVRSQFAEAFLLVFAQRLVPEKRGEGRLLAWEKITNSLRVKNLIKEGKVFNIRSLMQAPSADVTSIEQSLARLYLKGEITFEDGVKFSDYPAYYQELVRSATPG
jgi:twitching motility protein PilT